MLGAYYGGMLGAGHCIMQRQDRAVRDSNRHPACHHNAGLLGTR